MYSKFLFAYIKILEQHMKKDWSHLPVLYVRPLTTIAISTILFLTHYFKIILVLTIRTFTTSLDRPIYNSKDDILIVFMQQSINFTQ